MFILVLGLGGRLNRIAAIKTGNITCSSAWCALTSFPGQFGSGLGMRLGLYQFRWYEHYHFVTDNVTVSLSGTLLIFICSCAKYFVLYNQCMSATLRVSPSFHILLASKESCTWEAGNRATPLARHNILLYPLFNPCLQVVTTCNVKCWH